ncbi:MAG: J domain-containing protein [Pseudomonadota bacterium]
MTAEAYPLHWPEGVARTGKPLRARFDDVPRGRAVEELIAEINLAGGRYPVVSTNLRLRRDGMPYASDRPPGDKGVAVYFERKGRQLVYACDRWDKIEHNMRAITKTIAAVRGIDRWGASDAMERAFAAFEALPPPAPTDAGWWSVLGVARGASRADIEQAYRDLAKRNHPDHGGSPDVMAKINAAREQGLATVH